MPLAADPADPRAYAGLALGYIRIGHGEGPSHVAFPRARAAALRALQAVAGVPPRAAPGRGGFRSAASLLQPAYPASCQHTGGCFARVRV